MSYHSDKEALEIIEQRIKELREQANIYISRITEYEINNLTKQETNNGDIDFRPFKERRNPHFTHTA